MEPEQRQRIIGYFLEETQEYLDLLEPGMDDLENALADEERINELYRAAHSIKGGAAMLELDGIQKVAYRLESTLKFMKNNPVTTDRDIEATLLMAVLGIKRLVGEVRETQDNMTDASAAEVWGQVEPAFDELQQQLQLQVDGATSTASESITSTTDALASEPLAEVIDESGELDLPDMGEADGEALDELSWGDIEDLTNLENEATPTAPNSVAPSAASSSSGIEGLDALANLFDDNPLEANSNFAWDEDTVISAASEGSPEELSELSLDDLGDLEASLKEKEPSDIAAVASSPMNDLSIMDDLFSDDLMANDLLDNEGLSLGEMDSDNGDALLAELTSEMERGEREVAHELLSSQSNEAQLPQSDEPSSDDFDDLFSLTNESGAQAQSTSTGTSQPSDLDEVDSVLDELDAALDFDSPNSSDVAQHSHTNSEELQLQDDNVPTDNVPTADAAPSDIDPSSAIQDLTLDDITSSNASPEMNQEGDFTAALDDELTEADTLVSGEGESQADEQGNDSPDISPVEGLDLEDLELGLDEAISTPPSDSTDVSTSASSDALTEALDLSLDEPADFAAALEADLDLASESSSTASTTAEGTASGIDELDLAALDAELSGEASADKVDNISGNPGTNGQGNQVDTLQDLDDFLDSTELDLSQEETFDNLDSLLDEMTSSDGQQSAASEGSSENNDNFDDLDSLLDEPASTTASSPTAYSPSQTADDDFADMEKLLQGTESLAGPAPSKGQSAAAPTIAKPRSRSQRLREQSMRVPIKTLDSLSNLVGEMVVNRNSLEGDQDRLRQSLEKLVDHTQKLSDVGQKLQDLYERSLLENALLNSRRKVMGRDASLVTAGEGIPSASEHEQGSAVGELDDLELDKFTGFHTLSQDIIELIVRVRESASDIDFLINDSLEQDTRNFRQTTGQLEEEVKRSRMVPFSQTADRLPRAVRDIALKCGKSARLTTEGQDTLIDKMLIEQLHDPLTHLINNAVTHGIESPEERSSRGKAPDGSIHLQAFYQGNQTVISVADDGAGIDPQQIKRKAIQKGLVRAEDADALSENQLYDFLFHAGFSTRDQADAFAGRGVGMDVVKTRLNELRGTVVIDSEIGKGTTFTIRLPLTLSITKALQCISNRARIAFPLDGVDEMFDIPKEQIVTDEEGNQSLQWREMTVPVRSLSDLLKYNRTIGRSSVYAGTTDDDMVALVLLRSAGEYLAVSVDRVEGEMDIVIKQLEGPVPKPAGIAGATVLADGQVMPIADVLELIDISKGRSRQGAEALWEDEQSVGDEQPAPEASSDPMVLIVDDSITVRELLSMSFAKSGYRVEQARDGQEAWEKLRSGLPCNLVFCDIEMPRMTGLELLEKLQTDDGLKQLPMAMLTSRGADKHRQLAAKLGAKGYFTKPYLEEALLEAANRLLQGEVLLNADGSAA